MIKPSPQDSQLLATRGETLMPGSGYWKEHAKELQKAKVVPLRQMEEFKNVKFVLYPDDTFYELWSHAMTLLLLYTATVTPYRVALIDYDSNGWSTVDYVIDALFFTDILCNTFLAYYDEKSNLVTSKKQILIHYARTWMIPDVMACVPFQLIMNTTTRNVNNLIRLAKLPRLYRFIKFAKLFRILKVVKNRKKLMQHVNSVLQISISVERLIWFIIGLLLLLHLFSCIWIFIGRFMADEDDNWIMMKGFQDFENMELYLVGLYFSVTTLATVGYGDITPCNNAERMVCAGMMLLGIFVYSCTIGSLTNLILNIDQRKAKLDGKMELLLSLASRYKLSKPFLQKLSMAIEYEHRNNNDEVSELVDSLPSLLRTELLIAIYQNMIENNLFFEKKSMDYVAAVAPYLLPLRLNNKEFVYKQHEYAAEMFFLIKGKVDYVLLTTTGEASFYSLVENEYFGAEDLLFSRTKQHFFTTKTKSKCELLSLSREHFEEMMSAFENEAKDIRENAIKTKAELDQLRSKAKMTLISQGLVSGQWKASNIELAKNHRKVSSPPSENSSDTEGEDDEKAKQRRGFFSILNGASDSPSPSAPPAISTHSRDKRHTLKQLIAHQSTEESPAVGSSITKRVDALEENQAYAATLLEAIAEHLGVPIPAKDPVERLESMDVIEEHPGQSVESEPSEPNPPSARSNSEEPGT